MSRIGTAKDKNAWHLQATHTRLFAADIARLKHLAEARGIGWQVELRLLVHRALEAESIPIIDEPRRR